MTETRTSHRGKDPRLRGRSAARTWVRAMVALLALVAPGCTGADSPASVGKEPSEVPGRPGAIPSEPGIYLFDLETQEATHVGDIVSETPNIAVSPDGTMVAYPDITQGVINVASVDGTNVHTLVGTGADGGVSIGPRFSPDGSQILYQAKTAGAYVGDLFLVDVATGRTTQLTHLEPVASGLWFMGPSFSPDGETVLFHRPDADYSKQPESFSKQSWGVWSVPSSGGRARLLLRDAVGARLSPDGRRIVYFKVRSGDDPFDADMWVANADGTDARPLVRGDLQTLSARWSPDATMIAYAEWGPHAGRGSTYVVDVSTHETTRVLDDAYYPEWVDAHTWIVGARAH